MPVFQNIAGTTTDTFKLGKGGPTIHKGGATPTGVDGDFWLDSVGQLKIKLSGVWEHIHFDNLQLSGNTISSRDTNGNVSIVPDGVGDVILGAAGGGTSTMTAPDDQSVVIQAGPGTGANDGGDLTLQGGSPEGAGATGNVILGATGGASSTMTAPDDTDAIIQAGPATTGNPGADLYIRGGDGTGGTGIDGNVVLDVGNLDLSTNDIINGGTITATSFSGPLTGNASTADAWSTARTVTFATGDVTGNFTIDGSANVSNVALTVGNDSHTHDAGNLTGTTLAATVVTSSLTTVGTIGTGVWQGSIIAEAYLQNQSGTNTGDSDTNLSVGTVTATNVPILSSDGTDITTLPAATGTLAGIVINGAQTFGGTKTFSSTISGDISGSAGSLSATLVETSGGTGISGYATGDMLYASASDTLTTLSAGTNTHVLTLAGGVPTWAAPAPSGNSFATQTVTDTDSGYTWAETGSAVADSVTDTLTWVSGTDIDLDVDATNDAIRVTFSNDTGYTTNVGTVTQVNNGNGMNFTNFSVSGTVTLGTPSSSTSTSTNATTASSHTHAIDSTIARSAITISTTAPITGGGNLTANRTIAMPAATTSADGYLTSTDWNTFNNKVSNVTTNLSTTHNASTVVINSSDGTNATINAATATTAGIMSEAIYDQHVLNNAKVTNVSTNLSLGTITSTNVPINSSDGTNITTLPAATASLAGIVTNGVQSFGGNKTFTGSIYAGDSVLTVDGAFGLTTLSATVPALLFESNAYIQHDRTSDIMSFIVGGVNQLSISTTIADFQDNAIDTTGAITGASFAGAVIVGGHTMNDIDITSEYSGANDHLMTSQAINNRILDFGYTTNTGTVTDVSVTTANGVSGSVATSTTTPAITLTLGAITPTSVGGITSGNLLDKSAEESISGEYTFTHADGLFVENAVRSGYLSGTHTTAFGATIWGMGKAYTGSDYGDAYAATGVYGISYLRSGHTLASSFGTVGEGLYVIVNGAVQAGIGSTGIKTDGNIVAASTITGTTITGDITGNSISSSQVTTALGYTPYQESTALTSTGITNTGVIYSSSDIYTSKVAMTVNDGYGNANLTFNHRDGTPSLTGSSGRIECATDGATASFSFELGNSTVASTPVALTQVATMTTSAISLLKNTTVTGTMAATTVTGANVTSGSDPGHTHTAYGTGDGTVTSVTVGTGLDITNGTTTPNITVDLSEFTIATTELTSADYVICLDGTAERKITLANFANEMGAIGGWTTNTGTVTSVTGGTGVDSTGGTTPSITLDLAELTTVTTELISSDFVAVVDGTASRKITLSNFGAEIDTLIPSIYNTSQRIGYSTANYVDFNLSTVDVVFDSLVDFRFSDGGAMLANGNITAYSTTISSDRKLKKDITLIENGLEKINTINGYEYTMKAHGKTQERRSAGLIAQEVQEVLPQAVSVQEDVNGTDNHLVLDYNAVSGLLVEAVKELSAEIEALKAEIKELKK